MPDMCSINPQVECRQAERLMKLEMRVGSLEDGQKKESDFRETYYDEQRKQIRRDEQLNGKLDALDQKISAIGARMDQLASWREEQQQKPAKRWDGLVDKAIWGVLGAVLAFLLARFGL